MTATHVHPYENAPLPSTINSLIPSELRKLTAAQSWAEFRSGTGMGSTIGRTFMDPDESRRLKDLLDGSRLTVSRSKTALTPAVQV